MFGLFFKNSQKLALPKELQVRCASKKTGGSSRNGRDSAGEYVIPGNILMRQRGTKFHPGENVGIGKDHTLYAKTPGYVRFYKEINNGPCLTTKKPRERRIIAIALTKDQKFPADPNAPRTRGFFLVDQTKMKDEIEQLRIQHFEKRDAIFNN
ncbi:hypothetical protein BB559_006431 [Furculomyces boomerangus]|uniref:Large ribosomal subunit protein bL27m n=2 Tax=Harpellales TaxID=61421 RepID=A0A2T9Y2W2_9FUNG|nr:hypothetical protein BB559_006431 [Furculomyces boomerangus]PWA00722.1 hypothetical protein BB558_003179 [Smittium angustum]